VIALEVADLVVIAGRTLGLDTAQVLDLLDLAAAERALAQARPGRDPGDLVRQAAVLLDALVRGQPLRRGNQQVALAAMLQFLALNGQEMDPDPPGPVVALVAGLAAGMVDISTVADQLAPRLLPAASVKEAPMPGRPVRLAMRLRNATTRTQPDKGVFARFTDRARRAVHLAQEEARLLRHEHVGTEHLLLGLLYEGEGVAARALQALGISREDVRGQVEEIAGPGQGSPERPVPFTPRAKKVVELSLREALALGHHYIGTEHLLLALLRDGEGFGARVLTRLGADDALVRGQVLGLLSDESEQAGPQTRLAADLADAADRLTRVRQQKEAAFDAGDLDDAAALRDQEKHLLAEKQQLEILLTADRGGRAIIEENQRLHREVDRLRALLRQHGIEPDGGSARTAWDPVRPGRTHDDAGVHARATQSHCGRVAQDMGGELPQHGQDHRTAHRPAAAGRRPPRPRRPLGSQAVRRRRLRTPCS
jgi:prophage maintenance system killer protein